MQAKRVSTCPVAVGFDPGSQCLAAQAKVCNLNKHKHTAVTNCTVCRLARMQGLRMLVFYTENISLLLQKE